VAVQKLQQIREQNEEAYVFLKIHEKAAGNKQLDSFLIMPVQRLPRYLLLLKELIKNTPSNDPYLSDMNEAHDRIKKVAEAINKSLHTKVDVEKVKMLESMFEKDGKFQKLAAPHRILLKQGEMSKRFSKKRVKN